MEKFKNGCDGETKYKRRSLKDVHNVVEIGDVWRSREEIVGCVLSDEG